MQDTDSRPLGLLNGLVMAFLCDRVSSTSKSPRCLVLTEKSQGALESAHDFCHCEKVSTLWTRWIEQDGLTMLFLLHQALLGNLDVSLASLQSLGSAFGIVN